MASASEGQELSWRDVALSHRIQYRGFLQSPLFCQEPPLRPDHSAAAPMKICETLPPVKVKITPP